MEHNTDAGYKYAKSVCKDFKIKNLGEYHDLYAQGDTLLLADVFSKFRNMCLEIYELHPARFFFSSRVSMGNSLKIDENKIRSSKLYQYVINCRKRY